MPQTPDSELNDGESIRSYESAEKPRSPKSCVTFESKTKVSPTEDDENKTTARKVQSIISAGSAEIDASSREKLKTGGQIQNPVVEKLKNYFNYSEETSNSHHYHADTVEAATVTAPPPVVEFSAVATQSVIHDMYLQSHGLDSKIKQGDEMGIPKNRSRRLLMEPVTLETIKSDGDGCKTAERVFFQNIYDKYSSALRYFEDPADNFRTEGNLLPLYRFKLSNAEMTVTHVQWNPKYKDLLGVAYGSVGFPGTAADDRGAIALFTLKNPAYPEYVRMTHASALCIAFHPTKSRLALIGMNDGRVAVYDTSTSNPKPQYNSDASSIHLSAVSSVSWKGNSESLEFYSISDDGYVKNWVLMSTHLQAAVIRIVHLPNTHIRGRGTCLKFHLTELSYYLIGVMGYIAKCSIHTREDLFVYHAHDLDVLHTSWNHFVPDIFLSCSADGTIKMWEDSQSKPLLRFELGLRVIGVEWAPYSSTVFAACTTDGTAHVFDININRCKPVHQQRVISSRGNEPTAMAFNPIDPVLTVGDDLGNVRNFKLSPNLRIPAKLSKKAKFEEPFELEVKKLKRVLAVLVSRTLEYPLDNSCSPLGSSL